MFRPVRQRLVRTHPVTGRRSLYLSSHAGGIVGMPMPEARILLRDLTEHATQPRFVYVHTWRPWDLVMWDNRQMMHRVRRYDEPQPRDMRRTTVAGDAPTVGPGGGGLTPPAPHGPPADLPRPPDRAGHDASGAGHRGGGRGVPDHRHPAHRDAERGRPSLRHSGRRAAPARDRTAAGGYGSVRPRHGVPALRARAAGGNPRRLPGGVGAARRAQCARHERRARGNPNHRAVRRSLRPGGPVRAPRVPGVRDLHGGPDARPRRPRRGPVAAGQRLGAGGCPALQSVGGIPAHVAQVDPSLFRYAQICDASPDVPGPGDTRARPRGSHGPASSRRGRLAAGGAGGGVSRACPWPWRPRAGRPPSCPPSTARSARIETLSALIGA